VASRQLQRRRRLLAAAALGERTDLDLGRTGAPSRRIAGVNLAGIEQRDPGGLDAKATELGATEHDAIDTLLLEPAHATSRQLLVAVATQAPAQPVEDHVVDIGPEILGRQHDVDPDRAVEQVAINVAAHGGRGADETDAREALPSQLIE